MGRKVSRETLVSRRAVWPGQSNPFVYGYNFMPHVLKYLKAGNGGSGPRFGLDLQFYGDIDGVTQCLHVVDGHSVARHGVRVGS